jgi:predicted nuclease of predicted toxin-antitoxin system
VRFLLDQDVYAVTGRFLRALGHDVVTAAELNLSRSPDIGLLNRAVEDRRLLVTRDKDFGGLVFVERTGRGVLLLRISPEKLDATHAELKRVLDTYSEIQLAAAFVVVEPGRHRFRAMN